MESAADRVQDQTGPVAILHVGGVVDHRHQEAERVDQDVPLAAVDLLPRVVAVRPLFGRLDRLAVEHPGGGLAMTPLGLAEVAPQLVEESVDGAVLLPRHEVPVDDLPGRQFVRHRPPLAAGAGDVEEGVDDLAPLVLGRSAALLGSRDESGDLGPLRPGQIAGIGLSRVQARRLGHAF